VKKNSCCSNDVCPLCTTSSEDEGQKVCCAAADWNVYRRVDVVISRSLRRTPVPMQYRLLSAPVPSLGDPAAVCCVRCCGTACACRSRRACSRATDGCTHCPPPSTIHPDVTHGHANHSRCTAGVWLRAAAGSRQVRVRVEIMGSQKCRIVGTSQPVLIDDRSLDLHPHP
jgi:hypothetical protein